MVNDGFERKRRIVNTIISKVISLVNRDIDVVGYQEKYKATSEKIIQGRIVDIDRKFCVQIKDGEVCRLHDPERIDGWFETDCSTIINLFRGKIKVVNPATMEEKEVGYTPIDAIRYGDLTAVGDASSNDLLLFATAIYKEAYPQIKKSLDKEYSELRQLVRG